VVTLALGIGANTAIFSVIDATLLARSPWIDAERMVTIQVQLENMGAGMAPTLEEMERWAAEFGDFERLEARAGGSPVLTHSRGARRVNISRVTPGYLSALGVRPAIGRFLTADDMEEGAPRVAVLPASIWRGLYGADAAILGRYIELNGEPHIVVGVAPTIRGISEAVYASLSRTAADGRPARAIGRAWLKPGVTLAEAQARFQALARGEDDRLGAYVGALEGQRNVFWERDDFRTGLLALFVAVFLVLTIACVNVANLLLTNLGRRRGEFAVRAAIGATRARLARFVLAECGFVAALGGALGVLVAQAAVAGMRTLQPGSYLDVGLSAVRLDARVLLYAIALSAVTAVLFGVVPALRRSTQQPAEVLQAAAIGRGSARWRIGGTLVATEAALAVVLLVGAGLMFHSFLGLRFADPGFDADRVLGIGVGLPPADYPDTAAQTAMIDSLALEIGMVSGVEGVQFGQASVPPDNMATGGGFTLEGTGEPSFPQSLVSLSAVQAGYFEFMGIPLLAGRDFIAADFEAGEGAERAVVVSSVLADKYWPAGDALGSRFRYDRDQGERWNVVVGVAARIPHLGLESPEDIPHLYIPLEIDPRYMDLMVRLADRTPPPISEIRAVFERLDPRLPTEDLDSAANGLTEALSGPRFRAALFGAFGLVAIMLTAVGIFGVVANTAAQRQREMAIRLALGAAPGRVLGLVMGQGMLPVLIGLAMGTAGSLALGRLVASLLHDLAPADVTVYATVLAGFVLIAVAATWIPARRATAVDVMDSLRAD
jgi:predicted permease